MKVFSFETIDFQNNDKFPDIMSSIVASIYSDIESGLLKTHKELVKHPTYCADIEKAIRARFNLNIVMERNLSTYMVAAIIPFSNDKLTNVGNVNNVSPNTIIEAFNTRGIFTHVNKILKEREEYRKRIHNRTGFVNNKLARVGGYLADVKHHLIVNFHKLKKMGLTPEEVTSVILHEIGHAYTGLENHYKFHTSNAVISGILDDMNNNKIDKALYTYKKHFTSTELTEATLNNQSSITDFYGELARTYVGEISSVLINSKYDETNFENMSDSFATRFNMGTELTSSLVKMYGVEPRSAESVRIMYFINLLFDIVLNVMLLTIFGVGGVIVFLGFIFFISGTDNMSLTYDHFRDRLNRIRNTVVANLKNTDIPDSLVKSLLDQYDYISSVMNGVSDYTAVSDLLADVVLTKNRDAAYYIALQKTVENSLNNQLFVTKHRVALA